MEPCGTPCTTFLKDEKHPLQKVRCCLHDKYEENKAVVEELFSTGQQQPLPKLLKAKQLKVECRLEQGIRFGMEIHT